MARSTFALILGGGLDTGAPEGKVKDLVKSKRVGDRQDIKESNGETFSCSVSASLA